jgi:serine/threonine-protein kinase
MHLEAWTGVVAPSGTGIRTVVVPPRRRGLVLALVAGGLMLVGGAFVVGRNLGNPPPAPEVRTPPVPVPAPAVAPAPQQLQPPSQALPEPEAAVAQPPVEAEPPRPPVKEKVPARSSKKRVSLEAADVQRVVLRNRARIMACFEQYKRDLPANEGDVQMRFTIYSSGKADAATQGALATRPVGRCLEKQVERLRFPQHRDKEVTLVLPFGYHVTR